MEELGPLSLMYSWQALICATACVGITQMIKTIIDIMYLPKVEDQPGGPHRSAAKEKRKENLWVTRVTLPVIPVLVGAVWAAVVPLRPDVLVEYVKAEELQGLWMVLAYGGWGGACGQFSTMLHSKLKDLLHAKKPS